MAQRTGVRLPAPPQFMQYAPLPTDEQLARVRDALGARSLIHAGRFEGGLGCTMDVLAEPGSRIVLRRYGPWYHERGEDAAAREIRALELLQKANVPAPAPIWLDTDGVFEEQAILISYVDAQPELTPSNPFDWAERLATTLTRIHDIRLDDEDRSVFLPGAGEDIQRIQNEPEVLLEHPLGEELLRRRVTLGQRSGDSEQVFSHTDYWPGNTLWSNDELRAVVDWESPSTGPREMDLAYCSFDIRYLGMDKVAERFVSAYREESDVSLDGMAHWEAVALCRPMPDIAKWVPAWNQLGRQISIEQARTRYTGVLEEFLKRTA